MNDFSELEGELKKLRPAAISSELAGRVANELARHSEFGREHLMVVPRDPSTGPLAPLGATDKAPSSRRITNWLPIGLGFAAAAGFLLLARMNVEPRANTPQTFAASSPAKRAAADGNFVPSGVTQVVYNTRDEGLHFTPGVDRPVRRQRVNKRETLQWQNPETGASLRVSYPTEEVTLTPISVQ